MRRRKRSAHHKTPMWVGWVAAFVFTFSAALVVSIVLMQPVPHDSSSSYPIGSEGPQPFRDEPDALPRVIHWHPQLQIFINGNETIIPANIGIFETGEAPIHTHDNTGTLHIEQRRPTPETIQLGYFFKVWGEPFNGTCIFRFCTNATHVLRMNVNGHQNQDFENLTMYDEDFIVILFGMRPEISAQF